MSSHDVSFKDDPKCCVQLRSLTYTVTVENQDEVLAEIQEKVSKEGLDANISDQECLLYLWKLYKQAENDRLQIQELHRKEMEEVDHYVEHIQQLSEEREVVLQGLELQNKQLGERVTQLIDNPETVQEELKKMLEHQGLQEILDCNQLEQIAFLLAERAHLLDELEDLQENQKQPTPSGDSGINSKIDSITDTIQDNNNEEKVKEAVPSSQVDASSQVDMTDLKQQLEKDSREYEEELQKIHENWQLSEKRMKDKYEEEINTVLEENERMEEELTETRMKMEQLEEKVESLKKEVTNRKNQQLRDEEMGKTTPTRRSSDVALRKVIEDKTKVETELVSLKSQFRNLEQENKNVKSQIEQVQSEAEDERDRQQQLRYKANSLRSDVDELELQLDEKQASVERLSREKSACKTQLELVRKELKEMKVQKEQLETWQDIAEIMSNDKKNLSEKVDFLNVELKEIRAERDKILEEKHQLSKEELVLSSQLDESQRETEQHKAECVKARNDYEWLESSKLELASRMDDLQTDVNNLKKENEHLEETLEKENKYNESLRVTIEELRADVEKYRLEGQEAAKQQIVIVNLREQNKILTDTQESLKQDIQNRQGKAVEALERQQQLQSKHEDVYNSLTSEIEDLKSKLKLTLEELGKARSITNEQKQKHQQVLVELETHLQETQSKLSEATGEHQNAQTKVQELETEIGKLSKELVSTQAEVEQIKSKHEQNQLNSQGKLLSVEKGLKKKLEELMQQKDVLEKDLNSKLSILEEDHYDITKQLQTVLAEKTSLEQKLNKALLDTKNSENELSNAESVQRDLREKLEASVLAKDDISEKLVLALQKLEAVQQELSVSRRQHRGATLLQELYSDVNEESQELALVPLVGHQSNGTVEFYKNRKSEVINGSVDAMKSNCLDTLNSGLPQDMNSTSISGVLDQLNESLHVIQNEAQDGENVNKVLQKEAEALKLAIVEMDADSNSDVQSILLERLGVVEELSSSLQDKHLRLHNQVDKLLHHENELKRVSILQSYSSKSGRDCTVVDTELTMRVDMASHGSNERTENRKAVEVVSVSVTETKLNRQLESALQESRQLRGQLEAKQKEILQLQHDTTEARLSASSVQTQLHVESKLRNIVENKNSSLNNEVSKAYDEVKQLLDRSLTLETNNQSLQEQLSKMSNISAQTQQGKLIKSLMSSNDTEMLQNQRSANQLTQIRNTREQIIQAELKSERLQQEVDGLVSKLDCTEREMTELRELEPILSETKGEVVLYKRRFEEEKIKSKLLQQSQNQLRQEVNRLQSMDNINYTWQEQDSNWKNSLGMNSSNDEIHNLRKEVKDLKMALLSTNERQELQQRKYEDRKLQIRAKFLRARQLHNQEKGLMKEQVSHLGEDLLVTRSMFNKEHELREEMESSHKRLSNERRELLSKNSEQVETIREMTRSLSKVEVQSKFLEEENKRLQEKLIAANHRQSISQRANQKMLFQHQLSSPKSDGLESVLDRSFHLTKNGIMSSVDGPFARNIINLNHEASDQLVQYTNPPIHSLSQSDIEPKPDVCIFQA